MHGGSVDNLIFTKKFWTPRNYTVHFPWLKCGFQKCHYQAKSDICGYCLYLPKTLWAVTSQLPANGVCQILSHVHLSLDGNNCCFPKWSRSKRCRERITRTKKKQEKELKKTIPIIPLVSLPFFHTFSHHKQQIITFMAFFQKHSLTCKRNWKHSINIAKGINKRNWGIPMLYWRHLIWFNSWTLLLET